MLVTCSQTIRGDVALTDPATTMLALLGVRAVGSGSGPNMFVSSQNQVVLL
jgi:hypothetical protein